MSGACNVFSSRLDVLVGERSAVPPPGTAPVAWVM